MCSEQQGVRSSQYSKHNKIAVLCSIAILLVLDAVMLHQLSVGNPCHLNPLTHKTLTCVRSESRMH